MSDRLRNESGNKQATGNNKVGQILKMDFKDQESVPSSLESIVIMERMPSKCHVKSAQYFVLLSSPSPKSKVQSPKVKTKRTWADTKILKSHGPPTHPTTWPPAHTPPITFKHEGVPIYPKKNQVDSKIKDMGYRQARSSGDL